MIERAAEGVWRVPVASSTLPPFGHTNSYLLARSGVGLIVDPGGGDAAAVDLLAAALAAEGVREPKGILLTHTHRDHHAGVEALRAIWPDVTVYVHALELPELPAAWRPVALSDGRRMTLGEALVEAVHTPGHSPGHLAFWLAQQRLLLAGDLVAGTGSVWIGLPEGDVRDYLESLARAAALEPASIGPGHGPLRLDGAAVLLEAREHRLEREAAVITALGGGPLELRGIRARVYGELSGQVAELADRTLLAHLRELMRQRRVMHVGSDARGPYLLAPGA